MLQDLPVYMQMGLFSRLHDRRLCDLFAPKNATGFVGTCQDLPATCSQVTTRPLIHLISYKENAALSSCMLLSGELPSPLLLYNRGPRFSHSISGLGLR